MSYNFTQIDPAKFPWDDDGKYVQTNGISNGFRDGYNIVVSPERLDGAPMNLGCHVTIKNRDDIEADFHLDTLSMMLIVKAISQIMTEQISARYAHEEV